MDKDIYKAIMAFVDADRKGSDKIVNYCFSNYPEVMQAFAKQSTKSGLRDTDEVITENACDCIILALIALYGFYLSDDDIRECILQRCDIMMKKICEKELGL